MKVDEGAEKIRRQYSRVPGVPVIDCAPPDARELGMAMGIQFTPDASKDGGSRSLSAGLRCGGCRP